MDIVYIVGKGSRWNNQELKYSLRSIAKHGKNINNVCIVGYKPNFVSDKVIHIPCEDIGDKKHKRILNKILAAANSGLVSNDFLISSDDHFYIKDVDFDNYPIYYKHEVITINGTGEYFDSLKNTKQFLEANNLTLYQTNPHCNTHFNIEVYNKYKDLFDAGMEVQHGVETNCLMGNLLIKEGAECKPYRDVKVRLFKTRDQLLNKIGNSECFSIYDEAIGCGVGKYLNELFPDKCEYER